MPAITGWQLTSMHNAYSSAERIVFEYTVPNYRITPKQILPLPFQLHHEARHQALDGDFLL